MKKLSVLVTLLTCAILDTNAQSNTLNNVATTLFKNVKTKLTVAEKNEIATKLGFILSGNKDQPFASDKDSKDYPFTATVLPTDMNKDGKEEIFVSFGNSYTSGNAGTSIALFIKDAKGIYVNHLGFPGMVPDALATANLGYPDLLIGGPGMEYPVWRWNGKAYAFNRQVKDAAYEKLKKQSIEDVSKVYQITIKE
ncbi:hypothetical protein FRZ67_14295 [Panacibacter ginsenosidivorans]|uniref:VCBS repeat-containing protein n=1 Tax=Panacibacter ginsenosidivorans TaxID=1813871 RepID=A0A5B8VCK4_9BACT|nr:hypothetical protein [Panacibacter ginsenosidivorans]QEC68416.1 hypothetical protein FRZ67_14295 [Panacibacter ginsenosidivorans]